MHWRPKSGVDWLNRSVAPSSSSSVWSPTKKGEEVTAKRVLQLLLATSFPLLQSANAAVDCPAGTEKKVLDGKRGRIEYCERSDGTLHGPAAEWYPNGVQRTQDSWKDGKKDGTWTVWDEKGTRREERSYADGKLDGAERIWFENGRLQTLTTWEQGSRNGPVAQWLENGTQVVWGEYLGDKQNGIWTFRGPKEHEEEVRYAVYVDGADVTRSLLEATLSDCATWDRLRPAERAGVIAMVNLLALETTPFWKDSKDHASVAACLAKHATEAASELDAACKAGKELSNLLPTIEASAAVRCMVNDAE